MIYRIGVCELVMIKIIIFTLFVLRKHQSTNIWADFSSLSWPLEWLDVTEMELEPNQHYRESILQPKPLSFIPSDLFLCFPLLSPLLWVSVQNMCLEIQSYWSEKSGSNNKNTVCCSCAGCIVYCWWRSHGSPGTINVLPVSYPMFEL